MNLLIATLGGTWAVVPEIVGFTNPDDLPLYRDRTEVTSLRSSHGIEAVDEIWVVTTAHEKTAEARIALASWNCLLPRPRRIRCFWPDGLKDLRTAEDVRCMAELIHRLVLRAHERSGGRVWLSLAGGRKTMSSDLQQAGQTFGCRAMLHVVERAIGRLEPADLTPANAPSHGDRFTPIVVSGRLPGSEAVRLEWKKLLPLADLPGSGAVPREDLDKAPLLAKLEDIHRRSDALLVNYRLQLSGDDPVGNFRALYALPPATVETLKTAFLGYDPTRKAEELAWLQRLPKAELHCHLGGILSPAEMIEVAAAEADRVGQQARRHPDMTHDLDTLARHIAAGDEAAIDRWLGTGGFKGLRKRWPVPKPLGVCAFLLAFRDHEDLLSRLIYRDRCDPARFCGAGIETYERLGDLQGSGLLQSEATLKAALAVLARQCEAQCIRYLELRCSPLNYTRGGLTGEQVVNLLLDAIASIDDCDIRLIFIASRHGDPDRIKAHVHLAHRLLETNPRFTHRFVGFDLAGAEHAGNPARFRDLFRPLHERIIRITIHAGEGEAVRNIWEAVYELSADRIGHGLTLEQDPQLLARFRDRGIAIEMCPSSNFQIVGFHDHLLGVGDRPYPLGDHLKAGLRVTVNTDDPGISLTDLSREYHKAAAMTPGGLSLWQILQLLRNGFRAAFCGHEDRQRHLLTAENEVVSALLRRRPPPPSLSKPTFR